jgi:hypothetical protein
MHILCKKFKDTKGILGCHNSKDRHKDKNDTEMNTTHDSQSLCNTYQGKTQGENRGAPEEWVVTVSSVLLTSKPE